MIYECEKVGLDYFESAPVRHTASETIRATPDEIFAVFLDGPSWTKFASVITGVEWTSGFPLEVGSTRTVHMKGGITGYEEFIAFDHGTRMAFRFNQSTKDGMGAFAEDYQVTDLGNGTCRVDWVMAMGTAGEPESGGIVSSLRRAALGWFVRRTLKKFRVYVESSPVLEGVGR